jgi:hypothetical protein
MKNAPDQITIESAVAATASANDTPHAECIQALNPSDQQPSIQPKMVSGYGQFHTNEADPTKPDKKLTPYVTIDLDGIRALADRPPCGEKQDAQWVLPSTLLSRNFAEQEKSGEYHMLVVDFDTDPRPIEEVADFLRKLIPGCNFEIYTTKSATADKQKSRTLIPVFEPLPGDVWVICQGMLGDALEAAGMVPDRAAERSAQLCYLPNRGVFYASCSERNGRYLDPIAEGGHHIEARRQAIKQAEQVLQQEKLAATVRRKALKLTDAPDTIGAFNRAYTVQEILQRAGYAQKGDTFRHPLSESGSYSASIKDGRVHSQSSSDPLYTGGAGVGAHDAFSAFRILFAGSDDKAALKLAGDEWLAIDGESWNVVMRREYMEKKKGDSNPENTVDQEASSLDKFALNGSSSAMRARMLDDKFVVGRLAILGQVTFWYAQPNCGKTLLMLWLLIDGIRRGEINPKDVNYINADDNHKGLTFKTELGEKYGFMVLAPGYNDFKPALLATYLSGLIKAGNATGKVVILDTVKKFADIMNKKSGTQFGEVIRQFSMHGGTIIGLAHVNKHRNDDGKVIYSGTSDLVDDCDCAYTLDVVSSDASSRLRTVKFTNIKNRGDVALEASYQYDYTEDLSYQERLDSVKALSDKDTVAADAQKAMDAMNERNHDAVIAIREVILSGINKKTELIKAAVEASGLTKKAIVAALTDHTGKSLANSQYWHVTVKEDNAHVYTLNS